MSMLSLRMRPRAAQPGGSPARSESSALPADLVACIEAASVYPRHEGEDGELRAIVQIDGRGWVHTMEDTPKQLRSRWPGLSDAELQRAVRHIGAKVRQACAPAPASRKSWVRNW